MSRVIDAFTQFFDDSGDPLANGWLKFTVSGTNNTDKDTFSDINETIENTNPLQLDAAGRCPNVFGSGAYRVVSYINDDVLDQPGQQLEQFDPVGLFSGTADFEPWNAESIYSIYDIVTGDDGTYYRSLTNNNQNNDPNSDDSNWEKFNFIWTWNAIREYSIDDVAQDINGLLWVSITNNNINNDPISDNSVNWEQVNKPYDDAIPFFLSMAF